MITFPRNHKKIIAIHILHAKPTRLWNCYIDNLWKSQNPTTSLSSHKAYHSAILLTKAPHKRKWHDTKNRSAKFANANNSELNTFTMSKEMKNIIKQHLLRLLTYVICNTDCISTFLRQIKQAAYKYIDFLQVWRSRRSKNIKLLKGKSRPAPASPDKMKLKLVEQRKNYALLNSRSF